MSKFRLMLAIVLSLFLSSASFAEVGIASAATAIDESPSSVHP